MEDIRLELSSTDISEIYEHLLAFVKIGRPLIIDKIKTGLDTVKKADSSVVTLADKACERRFREYLAEHFPNAGILGEEEGLTNPDADLLWVIDPVDGTEELVHGLPLFGTVIGVFYKGKPIAGLVDHPLLDQLTSAAFGKGAFCNGKAISLKEFADRPAGPETRASFPPKLMFKRHTDNRTFFDQLTDLFPNFRAPFCCYSTTMVANGGVAVALDWKTHLWDVAANQIIIEEAGGLYYGWSYTDASNDTTYISVMGQAQPVEKLKAVVAPVVESLGYKRI